MSYGAKVPRLRVNDKRLSFICSLIFFHFQTEFTREENIFKVKDDEVGNKSCEKFETKLCQGAFYVILRETCSRGFTLHDYQCIIFICALIPEFLSVGTEYSSKRFSVLYGQYRKITEDSASVFLEISGCAFAQYFTTLALPM